MIIPVPVVVLLGVFVLTCLALSGWAVWQLKESRVLYMFSRNAEENLRTSLAESRAKLERYKVELDCSDALAAKNEANRDEATKALGAAIKEGTFYSKELSKAKQERDVALEKCKMAGQFEDKLHAEIDQNIAALAKLQSAVNSLADLPSDRSNEQ